MQAPQWPHIHVLDALPDREMKGTCLSFPCLVHEGHCASSLGNAPPFLQTFVLLLLELILGIFFPVILLLFVSVFLT